MRYPIPPEEVKEEDLTKCARSYYRPMREVGISHAQAMRALYRLAKEPGSMRVPTMQVSRGRAAKRKARAMIARGNADHTVRKETGLSPTTIGRLKNELDAEMEAAPA